VTPLPRSDNRPLTDRMKFIPKLTMGFPVPREDAWDR
jgi:hypothetical protein